MIFVFGSNLDGNHAGGAARFAHLNHGAEMGVGEGMTGNTYALPTVGHNFHTMTLAKIREHVATFFHFAVDNSDLTFQVTRVGCGIAGFKDSAIAAMFENAPDNCQFDEVWREYLPDAAFWGTF